MVATRGSNALQIGLDRRQHVIEHRSCQAAGVRILAADVVGGIEAGQTGREGVRRAVREGKAGELMAEFAQGAQITVEGNLAQRQHRLHLRQTAPTPAPASCGSCSVPPHWAGF